MSALPALPPFRTPSRARAGIAFVVRQTRYRWWRLRGMARALVLRAAYPGFAHGRGVRIDPTARITVTDGGTLWIGSGTEIDAHAVISAQGGAIVIGDRGYIGAGAIVVAKQRVEIGADALIAQYVSIRDHDHGFADRSQPYRGQGFTTRAVALGRNVWLGTKVSVMQGVTIGDDCVIGANAVVTRDLPARSVAVGIPARVVRTLA